MPAGTRHAHAREGAKGTAKWGRETDFTGRDGKTRDLDISAHRRRRRRVKLIYAFVMSSHFLAQSLHPRAQAGGVKKMF